MKSLGDIIALLLLILGIAIIVGGPAYYKSQAKEENVIELHARQWMYVPSKIVVKKGEKVTIRFTSDDVTHGLYIPAFGINEIIEPGKWKEVTFVPNKTGTFEIRCNVYCGEPYPNSGLGHWIMRGVLKVVE